MRFPKAEKEVNYFSVPQKVLIGIICALFLAGVITVSSGGNAISKAGYDTLTMLRYSLLDKPMKVVKDWQKDLATLRSVQEENEQLKNIIASTEMKGAELEYLRQKVQELETLLNLESISKYSRVNANVVYRDMNTWSNIITVDKGEKDGIAVDMAVVSAKGLIGKVVEVNKNSSKVKLLSTETKDVSVSIKIILNDEKTTEGILEYYDGESGRYHVQIYDANVKINEDMKVITSGNGGVFPSGILVGKVEKVTKLYNSKGRIVSVIPSVDFNDFESVAILKVD